MPLLKKKKPQKIPACSRAPYPHLNIHADSIQLHAMYTWIMDSIYVYILYFFV